MNNPPKINFQVDGEHESTSKDTLTAIEIMTIASIDPETNYLVQLTEPHGEISYKDDPAKPIAMKSGMRFITKPIGPMPVS